MDTDPAIPATRRVTRLLPWTGEEGKPCFLVTGDGAGGYLSRLADNVESVQLDMGRALVGHARALVDDPKTGPAELRYLSARLTESLTDVLRVAESRGARLSRSDNVSNTSAGEPGDGGPPPAS